MKIQTLSVVVGNNACNAKCPFCVSRMTGKCVPYNQEYNYRNLEKTCRFSQQNGVSTALITGKGEPLISDELYDVCRTLNKYFPFIELQTNGSLLTIPILNTLYHAGLTTVMLSMVHNDDERNNEIYGFKTPLDLKKTIKLIHQEGLSVRLSCIMLKGYIDSFDNVLALVSFCKMNDVEQLTIRSVEVPQIVKDIDVWTWTNDHKIDVDKLNAIKQEISAVGVPVMNLAHGGKVYDFLGQNLCVSNCLTLDPDNETMRQLIIYPNGHVYYDWQYTGAILL